jgi:hypothetical protein
LKTNGLDPQKFKSKVDNIFNEWDMNLTKSVGFQEFCGMLRTLYGAFGQGVPEGTDYQYLMSKLSFGGEGSMLFQEWEYLCFILAGYVKI